MLWICQRQIYIHRIEMILILKRIENMFKTKKRPSGYPTYLVKCDICWKEYPMIKYDLWKTEHCTTCANRIKEWVKWWDVKNVSWKWTQFYKKWESIIWRCNYEYVHWYKNYWWRGIKCEWNSFEECKNDMYESYIEHYKKHWEDTTIDRIDVNWNYNKDNCRWLTNLEQQSWKRNNRSVVYKWNKYPCLKALCREVWRNYTTVLRRINAWWDTDRAIDTI